MKARITMTVENDKPAKCLGADPENTIRLAYELMFRILTAQSDNNDKAVIENVEILDENMGDAERRTE